MNIEQEDDKSKQSWIRELIDHKATPSRFARRLMTSRESPSKTTQLSLKERAIERLKKNVA